MEIFHLWRCTAMCRNAPVGLPFVRAVWSALQGEQCAGREVAVSTEPSPAVTAEEPDRARKEKESSTLTTVCELLDYSFLGKWCRHQKPCSLGRWVLKVRCRVPVKENGAFTARRFPCYVHILHAYQGATKHGTEDREACAHALAHLRTHPSRHLRTPPADISVHPPADISVHPPADISVHPPADISVHPQQTSPYTPQQTSPYTPQQTSPYTPQQTSPYTPQQTSPYTPQQTSPYTPQQTSPYTPSRHLDNKIPAFVDS
ncbi:hypothetical protein P4O66_007051 [Electrophorus voltai]|uniref:Uncharacterized protein n=1 Tax=Electrophorus voltai TaxID=2609070 RepID=A0AAD9E1C5_9TELE|nr:hypothetical protein P4O66_007051 [Electrophorus voltai]